MPFDFTSPLPQLHTQRLLLRALTLVDADAFVPIAMRRGEYATSVEEAQDILQQVIDEYPQGRTVSWGLFLGEQLIGTCGYYRGFENNTGEVGYILHNEFQKQGYMQEALAAVLDFGFNQLELHTITAFTDPGNAPSVALLHKLSFTETTEKKDKWVKFELHQNQ